MKKCFYPFAALLLLIAVSFTACTKDEDDMDPPQVVNFPDALLLAQVKAKLGLSATEEVNTENILQLDTLNVVGEDDLTGNLSGIADLTGLEAATNLVYVRFGGTQVTDLTPIKDLEKVEYLRFNNTEITDISPISGYTKLTYFNANTVTGLTDISPLAGNTGLKELILRSVPFGNAGMATIANFTEIYRINMRSTEVTDISVLVSLMAGGALQNSTAGAAEAGGASLDLRGLDIDCSVIADYVANIADLEGC